MLQPAAPRSLQHSHRVRKKDRDSLCTPLCWPQPLLCVFVCVCGLCISVRHISSLWKQRTDFWSQTSASMYMHVFMNVCFPNTDFACRFKMKKARAVFMQPSVFIWTERAFLKPFVVINLEMLEKGFGQVAIATTVIHFNTHIATHTGALSDIKGSVSVTCVPC